MEANKVYQMPLAKVYPLLVAKAERKGRTEDEVRQIVQWLTGYTPGQLAAVLATDITYGDFFRNAPQPNPDRLLIKGTVCGVRVEDIAEPLMSEYIKVAMKINEIHNCSGLIEYINEIGFLPLLRMGLNGWSAEEAVDEECRYVMLPDGGWEWPLWEWKGDIIRESGCAYGKFFDRKAAFISREWWPDFCNWRRSVFPYPEEGSIEDMILQTLQENGSMITRDLRKACGFTGTKMRGKFDTYISRLEMGCYIVTEDFVYPKDRHGRDYGWGWSLLTTPEALLGRDSCHPDRTPEESRQRMERHFQGLFPDAAERLFDFLLK